MTKPMIDLRDLDKKSNQRLADLTLDLEGAKQDIRAVKASEDGYRKRQSKPRHGWKRGALLTKLRVSTHHTDNEDSLAGRMDESCGSKTGGGIRRHFRPPERLRAARRSVPPWRIRRPIRAGSSAPTGHVRHRQMTALRRSISDTL